MRAVQRVAAAALALLCLLPGAGAYKYVKPDVLQMSTSLQGHTTYRLTVTMVGVAHNLYAITGTKKGALEMPPAFQVPSPFGANMAGVNPAFFAIKPEAKFDSWLTVGLTQGDTGNNLGSAGLTTADWKGWGKSRLYSKDAGVFWMNPKDKHVPAAKDGAGKPKPVVLAQITIKAGTIATASCGMMGHTNTNGHDSRQGNTWREDYVVWTIGKTPPPSPPPSTPPPPPKNVNCVGAWSKCGAECKDVHYSVSTDKSGQGKDCPVSHGASKRCKPGDGKCAKNVDCVGSWSKCGRDCGDAFYGIDVKKSGQGKACEATHGARRTCKPGQGDCPPPPPPPSPPPPPPPPPPAPPTPPTPPPNDGKAHELKYVTSQVVQASASMKGYTTYRLLVKLKGDAHTLYTLIGSQKGPLLLPPAFQVKFHSISRI